jgi:hypothetical protein
MLPPNMGGRNKKQPAKKNMTNCMLYMRSASARRVNFQCSSHSIKETAYPNKLKIAIM